MLRVIIISLLLMGATTQAEAVSQESIRKWKSDFLHQVDFAVDNAALTYRSQAEFDAQMDSMRLVIVIYTGKPHLESKLQACIITTGLDSGHAITKLVEKANWHKVSVCLLD